VVGRFSISDQAYDAIKTQLLDGAYRPGERLDAAVLAERYFWSITPVRAALHRLAILTTDQRTYLIDALSTASGAYTSVLSWTYPQEEAKARAAAAAASASFQAQVVAPAVPVERLDFGYVVRTLKGRPPAWQPVRVFNDGAKTYIEFPPDLAVREAPPLFLLGQGDHAELVNYRLLGRYVVVDRLIDRAELRLGEKTPVVVRITRQGARS